MDFTREGILISDSFSESLSMYSPIVFDQCQRNRMNSIKDAFYQAYLFSHQTIIPTTKYINLK